MIGGDLAVDCPDHLIHPLLFFLVLLSGMPHELDTSLFPEIVERGLTNSDDCCMISVDEFKYICKLYLAVSLF